MKSRVGILLAGGLSSRYGSEKAFANIDGTLFYEKSYHVLSNLCETVIVVTRKDLIEQFPQHYTVITDVEEYVGCGPLAGIYSAMEHTKAEDYVVLPCDVPLITEETMNDLISKHQAEITVVETDGRLQPLISIWNVSTKDKIAKSLEQKQYRIRDVFNKASIMKIDGTTLTTHHEVFTNVNTPQQDREMRKWLKF